VRAARDLKVDPAELFRSVVLVLVITLPKNGAAEKCESRKYQSQERAVHNALHYCLNIAGMILKYPCKTAQILGLAEMPGLLKLTVFNSAN